MKDLKDFQSAKFQPLHLHLQDLYRLQNLAVMISDLESRAFGSNGLKLEIKVGCFLSQQVSTSSKRKTRRLSQPTF